MSRNSELTGALAEKADWLLPRLSRLFESNDIPFCLDGGTLLGLYREQRFLPWDDDIDLFMRGLDAPRILGLRWQLLLLGCRLLKSTAQFDYGPIPAGAPRIYKIKTLRRYGGQRLQVDLIFKYADAEHYHWVIGAHPPVHKRVARRFYDQFDTLHYKGNDYPVPCDTDAYLTARYGDWRIPVQEYSFKRDDHAIVPKSE